MLAGIAIVLLVLILGIGAISILVAPTIAPTKPNDSYISDEDYLNSGGKIVHHFWGKERE